MSNPDLERAREAATVPVNAHYYNRHGVPVEAIAKLILEQRAEEAEYCASIDLAWGHKARAADLRRQAGELEI